MIPEPSMDASPRFLGGLKQKLCQVGIGLNVSIKNILPTHFHSFISSFKSIYDLK